MCSVAVMNLYDVSTKSTTGIETYVAGPLKVWHIGGIIVVVILSIVVVVCCCVDVRIPRSKQQIEESHRRKHLLANYRQKYLSQSNPGFKTNRYPRTVHKDRGKISNNYPKYTSQVSDKRGRSNYNRKGIKEAQHARQKIEDGTPLSRDPTRWLGALKKIGVGGAPIRQQENLVKALSSLNKKIEM